MTWVRLDDTFAEDPRIEAAGPLALALYVAALSYSNRHLTDGVVTKRRVRLLQAIEQPDLTIQALIDVGLWLDCGDDIEIIDFHDWQPTSAAVRARRAAAAERQRKWRERQSRTADGQFRNAVTDGVTNAVTNTDPVPEPVPTRREGRGEGTAGPASADAAADPAAEVRYSTRADGALIVSLPEPAWSPND